VFVVVNNDGGGIFSFLPQAGFPEHFERVFGTPHGRSFERLAAFHDLTYRPIERADELTPAVQEGLLAGGLHLLEVRTERAENVAVHRRIAAAVGAALD
jgi:2-succinyl-5-enolpyruvyl-6-hydroxy-3-cyclohexene-1-carboxylate synthase